MKTFALIAAAAMTLSAGSAFAATDVIKASLETPVAGKTKFIAAGAVWNCEGTTCTTTTVVDRVASAKGCQSLAKEVGRVVSYGGRKALEASGLEKCNSAAAPLVATQQAAK